MIHFVVGTRAQLLKLAPVMHECARRELRWRWVYTMQHRDTMSEILDFLDLPAPDYAPEREIAETKSIGRMAGWIAHMGGELLRPSRALAGLTGEHHVVLTHGDTFSTVLGALLGRLTSTPVMHVEAGLRSFKLFDPFPEEINRLITFRLASRYACPGPWAVSNLAKYDGVKIDTGSNTQIDLLAYGLRSLHKSDFVVPDEPYVVASSHRYENLYDRERITKIIDAMERVALDYRVVMPRHPVTDSRLERLGLMDRLLANPGIDLVPRLPYQDFLKLIVGSEFVMTDGGGNQEELSYLGKPTLLLRDSTERQEGLGETTVLSRLDKVLIDDFVASYARYRRSRIETIESPSAVIVDDIMHYGA